MSEKRIYLTIEQAISCLNDGDSIHTFLNPAGILMGADWCRESVIETFNNHKDQIEIGGSQCRAMKHGLVVWRGDDPLFIEANEERLAALEKEITSVPIKRKEIVNNQPVTVDELLAKFEILSKPSSNVEYYGTDGQNVFIQFKNGSTYLYLHVSDQDIAALRKAESIGKFIPVLSKQYQYTKVDKQLVVVEQEPAQ